jgi:hypothetical protein
MNCFTFGKLSLPRSAALFEGVIVDPQPRTGIRARKSVLSRDAGG